MPSWDLKHAQEHLDDLYLEAQKSRLAKEVHPERSGMVNSLLSRAGDVLIDSGVWLKSRYHKRNGKPHRYILLDLG
jgi:hypothetical protein